MISRINFFFVIFLLSSCSINNIPAINNAVKTTELKGLKSKIYQTKNFNIFTLQKISDKREPIRIYVEGDGRAYINRYRVSPDPTPDTNFLLQLVMQDSSPNLVYIARPCQYVDSDKCEEKYWTSHRFSAEAIAAIQEVVNSFSPQQDLELVGYSGGAQIILHLTNKNIKNIRTINGNLDLEKFSQLNKMPNFLAPKLDYKRISLIRQTHFVGTDDPIIPIDIFRRYKLRMKKKNCINLKLIPDASHSKNWIEQWDKLLEKKPLCR